jgi:competence protein ComEC
MRMLDLLPSAKPSVYLVWFCLVLTFCQIVAALSIVQAWPAQEVELVVCDVGQGDAIFIKDRFTYTLVDAADDNNQALYCLTSHVPWFDSRLDLFVVTHPDLDHIGGAEAVLNRFEVSQVMLTADAKSSDGFARFRESVLRKKESGAQLLFPTVHVRGKMSNSIEYEVLSPRDRVGGQNVYNQELPETTLSDINKEHERNIKNYNERSIVLFLKAHDTSVLLTGDIETQTETALIKTNLLTQVDILKVAHHGSKSSSTPAFLDKVAPEVALISVGQKNRFGHPSLDVISRLKSIGTRVWRTDEHGEIVVRIDAQKYEVSAKR